MTYPIDRAAYGCNSGTLHLISQKMNNFRQHKNDTSLTESIPLCHQQPTSQHQKSHYTTKHFKLQIYPFRNSNTVSKYNTVKQISYVLRVSKSRQKMDTTWNRSTLALLHARGAGFSKSVSTPRNIFAFNLSLAIFLRNL